MTSLARSCQAAQRSAKLCAGELHRGMPGSLILAEINFPMPGDPIDPDDDDWDDEEDWTAE